MLSLDVAGETVLVYVWYKIRERRGTTPCWVEAPLSYIGYRVEVDRSMSKVHCAYPSPPKKNIGLALGSRLSSLLAVIGTDAVPWVPMTL